MSGRSRSALALRWQLDANKVPTGETVPIEELLPNPSSAPLRDYSLDDVFSDLVRDSNGRATMSVWGRKQRLDVDRGRRLSLGRRLGTESIRDGPRRTGPVPTGRAEFHLLRADGGHHECREHGTTRDVSRAADHRTGRDVACTFFDSAVRLRSS